jgi:hypothetical protein
MNSAINAYNDALPDDRAAICRRLAEEVDRGLPEAESKIWHRGPVWFLNGNPIVGYNSLKNNVQLLFWSGQSFEEPGLHDEGTFKAAQVRYDDESEIDSHDLQRWLSKARDVQWDYKNIIKNKGVLNKITDF